MGLSLVSGRPTVADARVRTKSPMQVAREIEQLAGELWGSAVDERTVNDLLAIAREIAAVGSLADEASAIALEQLCARCGHEHGDHLVDAPQACESDVVTAAGDDAHPCRCPGYLEPGQYAARDTERPPAAAAEAP